MGGHSFPPSQTEGRPCGAPFNAASVPGWGAKGRAALLLGVGCVQTSEYQPGPVLPALIVGCAGVGREERWCG